MIKFFLLLQDGKVPPPPGFSVPRPSSSSNGNNFHQRSFESKMSPHGQPPHPGLIKSSPLSDESPSSDRLSQSKLFFMKSGSYVQDDHDLDPISLSIFFVGIESPGDHQRKRSSQSSSLAEDIQAIRAAMDGASPSARERTLKTLERLTARLALAESERDMALGMSSNSISNLIRSVKNFKNRFFIEKHNVLSNFMLKPFFFQDVEIKLVLAWG